MHLGAYLAKWLYLSSKIQAEISSKTSVILDLHIFVVYLLNKIARSGPVSPKRKSCKFHHLIAVYDIEKVLYWLKHWWKLIDFLHTKAYCYLQLQIFSIIGSRGSEKNRQIATMDGVCPLPEPVINGWMLIFVKNQG